MSIVTKSRIQPFAHHESTGSIIRLALVNALFSFLTLSIWRFWGKTRVRRALWGGTTAWGDPLEYTGTGKELFLGFLMVLVVIMLPLTAAFVTISLFAETYPEIQLLFFPIYVVVAFLMAIGMYRARRYQLSRTVWRGIRGGLEGSAVRYAFMWMGTAIISIVTLGWAMPWADMKLSRFKMRHTTFGQQRFQCHACSGPIYGYFATIWLAWALTSAVFSLASASGEMGWAVAAVALGMPVIGLAYAGYNAARWREIAAQTRFGDMSFHLEASTWQMIRLSIGNILITVLSLGLLRPWAALRTFRFACAHLSVDGEIDFAEIEQSNAARPRTGEGLMEALDSGGAF